MQEINIYRKLYRWFRPWEYAKRRCRDVNHTKYIYYGGRGIKCTLTREEVIKLYERDNGYLLDKPSIDRIDPDGDYCYDNCRFIELVDNIKRGSSRELEVKPEPKEWTD